MPEPVVNFVIRSMDSVEGAIQSDNLDDFIQDHASFRDSISSWGDLCWCALTYFRLRDRGFENARLSDRIEPGCINIVHSGQLKTSPVPKDAFIVCIRGDVDPRIWAHYHIVQNQDQLGPGSSCIYLWPQPGLILRKSIPESVDLVGYLGQPYNGNLALHPAELAKLLQPHGFEFTAPATDWHDLSGFDAIIGIRSFDGKRHSAKPPSKLINAWLAGVPFIGGSDSAYAQCGQDGVDYLVARTRDELVGQLLRLKADPEFVQSLVRNGRKKVTGFDNDALAAQWRAALEGPISDRYRKWQANRTRERLRFAFLYGLDKALLPVRYHLSWVRNTIRNASYR
jgi:hypothetical protein